MNDPDVARNLIYAVVALAIGEMLLAIGMILNGLGVW